MTYHHLTHEERDRLAMMRSEGLSLRGIAKALGRSCSSLSRELKRNRQKPRWGPYQYTPNKAQKKAQARIRISHRRPRLKTAALHQAVVELLEWRWSPEQIAGHLKSTRPDVPSLSPETIYQWIYQRRPDLVQYLTRAHPKRRKRYYPLKHRIRIPGRKSIQERPVDVNDRQEAGHWETDLMVGPGSSALQVMVERQSRYCKLRRIPQRTASVSRAALTRLLESLPAALRRSMTYDNGAENAEHEVLNEDFGMVSYFCEPYHSWEKGTVENTNGVIRRWIPKQTRFDHVTDEQIQWLEDWLNDRPRKVLHFKTPRQTFQALSVALAP